MRNNPPNRISIDLSSSIIALAVVLILAATFTLASQIILILFLGVLFGVFLTKLSRSVASRLHVSYSGALGTVVSTMLLVMVSATAFFFVQINQQIEQASGKIDEGMAELQTLIGKYPAIKSTLATTPFLSQAIGVQQSETTGSEKRTEDEGRSNDEVSESDEGNESIEPAGIQLDNIPKPITQTAGKLSQMFTTTLGLVINSLLIFFVGLFLATSPAMYRDGVVCLVPTRKRERVSEVLDSTSDVLWRWLIGRFGSMLATGIGAFLLLLILGVPMAGTLGVLTALLTFVPNIGAAVALALATLFALPQGTATVGYVIGGYVALQLVESYAVTPLIQQKAASLPPALLIAFQAIMGVLFGFIGAAVASPLLAAGKTLVEMLYVKDCLESET